MKSARQDAFARALIVFLLACMCLLMVDCRVVHTPREGWNEKWGSLVPHETFPGDCGVCHVSDDWEKLRADFTFDHAKETGYALEGAHVKAACLRCHNDRGPVKVYVERSCGGCHPDPHEGNLGLDCTRCHNQDHWEPTGLIEDHARTRFPLVATHALVPCLDCHTEATTGDFRGAPVDCHLCHQREAAQAFPNHVINGWIRRCERCHTPANWRADGFNHNAFPLAGGHAGLDCTQCHVNGLFIPIPPDCFACHQQDYLAAPNHVADNLSTDCTLCHDINAWE